ncbi:MAG: RHS repeat-associated core domain-containing protein [Xanthomonadales bacterium]|nr:RHS repeat-associated core domain-containing protein [Xanthomonadales bacterium]
MRIDHPSGARGRFTFDVRRHGRANVESVCFDNGTDQRTHFPETPARYDTWSLTRKRIEGPGLPGSQNHPETTPYTWSYAYATPVGNFTTSPCSGGCPITKKTTIQAPDGSVTEHVFGIEFAGNDGKLLSTRVVAGGREMRRESYEYVQAGDVVPFPAVIGVSAQLYLNDSFVGERLQPQKKREIVQAGVTYSATTTAFDTWAYPSSVLRESPYGSKTEVTAYEHNTGKWVLGQKLSTTVDGLVASQTDYDPVTALPMRAYAFGKLLNSAEYYVANGENGALKSITDGNGKTTQFLDYHRGIARLVKLPTGHQQSAEVNNYGAITRITDELGNDRWFDYRPDGRLLRIRYPTGDHVAWNAREFDFSPAGAEFGLPAGHWTQTVTHGSAKKTTVFDALWRPVLEQQEDTARGDVHLTVQRYDDAGRKTFASYPRGSLCSTCSLYSVSSGTASSYDALGRLSGTSQTSELGPLTTVIRYADSGFNKTVTNNRGKSTTTHYLAFDEPVENWPVRIIMPESVVIEIDRDSFGKPRSITRSGSRQSDGTSLPVSATRSYVYDPYQQLCKTIEPEVGATAIGYDGAGNVSWTATGLNLPNAYQCNHDSASIAAVRSDRTYDALNRLLDTTFADGSPSIHRTYWPDGQPKTVRTTSAVDGDSTAWSYEYNARRLLQSETLAVDGATYTLTHSYSANGHPKKIVYPDLVEVDYAPDALGRPTQAANTLKSYATNVTYGPHGGMVGFTYGNGIVRTLEVNARGLPKRSHDVGVLDDTYGFDENANVSSTADAIEGASRTMQYDDLDRLESVAVSRRAPWQPASYVYDAIDNIRTSTVGGRAYTHAYDGSNRLQSLDVAGVPELVYAYERGNLSRRGQQTFVFDQANRMVSKSGESASTNERYAYDGHGRRVKIVRTASGATRHTIYTLDGQLRFEVDLARDSMTDFISLGGSLLAREESSAQQAPAAPVVTAPTDSATGHYTVSWTVVDGAATYVLEERQGAAGWYDLYSGPGNTLPLTRGNGTYQYRARACNASDCGMPGAAATTIVAGVTPPAPPSNLVVPSPSYTGNYELRWPASALTDRYQVFEKLNGVEWSPTPIHEGPDTTLRINARPTGAHSYRVVACGTGCGAPGIERTVYVRIPQMPVPAAPVLTVPSSNSTGTYVASWTTVAGATTYVLQEMQPDDWNWRNVYQGGQRAWTLVRPNGTYRYQVRSCNTAGECGDYGPVSTIVVGVAGQLAPPVPLGIAPGTSLDGNATVTWGAVGGATRYELDWNPNAAGWSQRYSGSLLRKTEQSLANGEYRYRARACDAQQCGDWTGESVLIVSQGSQAPPAVTSMTVSPNPSLDGTFTVSWAASPGATHYNLEERLRVGANGGEWTYPTASSQTATSRTFIGRGNGNYDYRIRACKTGAMPSCSNYGATASVQVQRPGGIDAPTSITGPSGCMTVGAGETVSFTIGWSAVVGATRYELEESDDRNGPISVLAAAGTTLTLERNTRRNREINYLYRARACNASTCSEWRGTAVACLVMPGTPRSVINQVRFLHTDALGSPVAETDEGGAVVKRTYYESYGAPVGGLYADGPGFTGHVTDSSSGLSYMQQRYYDPLAGRFLSLDPVVTDANTGGGFNRYWYANNNPHRFTDPDGRNPLNPLDAYDFAKDVGGLIVAEICYVAAVINDDAAVADLALEDMRSKVFDATASTVGFITTGGKQVKAIAAAANSSSDVKKATGAYTVTHESGIKYHGKGGERRMEASARRNEQQYADPVVKKEHTSITDARQAFMEEARRIAADGGPGKGNYNKINSPGKKYLEEDG